MHQYGWRFYQSADFEGGVPADFVSIDRSVTDCSSSSVGGRYLEEDFGISLSDRFLRQHLHTGFSVRANAHDGHRNVVVVPPNYVEG
jgi:hypothetical protein